jgi:hypothetical protein
MDQGQFVIRLQLKSSPLIIFTEWEDTRRWLEWRLREALADTDRADEGNNSVPPVRSSRSASPIRVESGSLDSSPEGIVLPSNKLKSLEKWQFLTNIAKPTRRPAR